MLRAEMMIITLGCIGYAGGAPRTQRQAGLFITKCTMELKLHHILPPDALASQYPRLGALLLHNSLRLEHVNTETSTWPVPLTKVIEVSSGPVPLTRVTEVSSEPVPLKRVTMEYRRGPYR